MSQAGLIDIETSNPQIPTQFDGDTGSGAIPIVNVLEIIGGAGITTDASGNTITVSLTGGGSGIDTIVTDSGSPGVIPDGTGLVNILGGEGIDITGQGPGNTITIAGENASSTNKGIASFDAVDFTVTNGNVTLASAGAGQSITGDSGGTLPPSGGNWNLFGSGSITTVGSGSTITTQLTGLTNHALLVGAGTTTITKVGPSATSGQVLQSSGAAADPAFSTATFPSTATGTGTILRADGTNWVSTTSTYPNTNAVSTLLYASSANVMSALATANNGSLVTSNTGVPSILAGPGTTGQILQSNAAAAPSFSTASYPSTTTINQILYSSSANTLAGLATANSGVLTTSTGGIPSIDTTNFQVLTTGVQMKGNNTNTAPPAGFIGEQIRATLAFGSATALTSTIQKTVTSISLTAGIWDVSAIAGFNPAAGTNSTLFQLSISNTTNVLSGNFGDETVAAGQGAITNQIMTLTIPSLRITLSATTTYYLVVQSTFTVSTMSAYGRISATRVG